MIFEDFNASLALNEEQKHDVLLCVENIKKPIPIVKKSTLKQQHNVLSKLRRLFINLSILLNIISYNIE